MIIEVCQRSGFGGTKVVADEKGRAVREECPMFHAQVKGHPEIWEVGISRTEAIGKLVITHSGLFPEISIEHLGVEAR